MNFSDYVSVNKKNYLNCLNKNSDNHLAVNWGSKNSQFKRFEYLCKISPNFLKDKISVLDVGCGIGHLVDFLKENNFQGEYCGIDLLEEMVMIAKRRHPEMSFYAKRLESVLDKKYDYVVMSGIFTNANEYIYHKMISMAFNVCVKGVSFNSLSLWSEKKEEDEFYADPVETINFCANITRNLVLHHNYLQHDFTVYIYK